MSTKIRQGSITFQEVREFFDYDQEDGVLRWRTLPSGQCGCGRVKVGDIAGNYSAGYGSVSVGGIRYMVHRLIFTWVNGYYPENFVDHVDGDPTNNRHTNLREVSQSCNMRNSRLRSNNHSGVAGVGFIRSLGKYRARININGVEIHLGKFDTMSEAVAARYSKELEIGWSNCKAQSSASKWLEGSQLQG